MSLDVEASLREALRAEVGGMSGTPDIADVSRRVRRRRRQHRVIAAVPAVLLVLAAIVALRSRGDEPVSSNSPAQPCVASPDIPFRPGALVAGWLMPSAQSWRLLPDAHVAAWPVPDGMIEVWNGVRDDFPAPTSTDRVITVLGRQVSIGPISDGFSVAFELGPTRCDRWAIVAHPGVTEDELATIATGLVLAP
jgi:hypothetical protein